MARYFFWLKFDETPSQPKLAAATASSRSIWGGTIRPFEDGKYTMTKVLGATIRHRAEASSKISFNLLSSKHFSFYTEDNAGDSARVFRDQPEALGECLRQPWKDWAAHHAVVLTSLDVEDA
jgi:hypothetical protein